MSLQIFAVRFSINNSLKIFANEPTQVKIRKRKIRIIACSAKELLKIFTPGTRSWSSFPTKLPTNLDDKATIPISSNPLTIDSGNIFQTNVFTRLLGKVDSKRFSLFNVLLLNRGNSYHAISLLYFLNC